MSESLNDTLLVPGQVAKPLTRWIKWTIGLVFLVAIVTVLIVVVLPESPKTNKQWQKDFMSSVDTDRIRANLEFYTSKAHLAGTSRDYETAVYTRDTMLSYGIPDVEIQQHTVLLTYPLRRSLSMVSPYPLSLALTEAVVPQDPTSDLPTVDSFLGYGAPGNVTAKLVYANYGRREDFETLAANGITVAGNIAIVRYGKIFRGNKVWEAQTAGAIGCIIYSDPADDGYEKGATYPDGPWRPETGLQRGTVWLGNGDPLTPGWPSVADGPRIPLSDAFTPEGSFGTPLPSIPAIPISWGDAYALLQELTGPEVAELNSTDIEWEGGLNFTYHVGPGATVVNLDMDISYNNTLVWNVVGKIKGGVEADRVVLIGNHRDAWTFGGADPSSGTSVLMEVAKGFGSLLASGWTPRRSIWLCSWDAEEFALIGSTEFVELHEKTMLYNAVAYINTDTPVTGGGIVYLEGVPSLADMVRSVAKDVPAPPPDNPANNMSLYDLWQRSQPDVSPPVLDASEMGTGSDFGAFLQHTGVPCINVEMKGNNDGYGGVYHSNYDSFYWMSTFGDPTFERHAAMTKLTGVLAMNLADSVVLPFLYTEYGKQLKAAVDQLKATNNATSHVDFNSLDAAITNFQTAAISLDALASSLKKSSRDALALRQGNDVLQFVERGLLFLQGLTGREWYRHVVWATSLYDGYGSSAFSPISDALVTNDWVSAQQQIGLTSIVVNQCASIMLGGTTSPAH